MNLKLTLIFFAIVSDEFGFRVEQIHLARTTMLEQANHRIGTGSVMRRSTDSTHRTRQQPLRFLLHQIIQRKEPNTAGDAVQKRSPILQETLVKLHRNGPLSQTVPLVQIQKRVGRKQHLTEVDPGSIEAVRTICVFPRLVLKELKTGIPFFRRRPSSPGTPKRTR